MTKEMGKKKIYVRKEICKRIFLKLGFRVMDQIQWNCVNPNLTFLGFNLATKRPHLRRWRAAKTNRLSPVQSSTETPNASGRWEFIKWVSPIMFPNFPNYFCIACSSIIHKFFIMLPMYYYTWFLFCILPNSITSYCTKIFFGFLSNLLHQSIPSC